VHVLYAAEVAVEGGGEDDDWDVGAASTQAGGDFGAELAGAEVVVEDRNVNVVKKLGGFFDGGGGNALVTVLAKDGGAKVKVGWFVVEQKDADGGGTAGHTSAGVGRLDHDDS
jgi:hypothetical protein